MAVGRTSTLALICAIGACLAPAIGAAPAGATTVGSNLLNSPDAVLCAGLNATVTCTLAAKTIDPAATANGGAASPIDGVLTGWTIRTAASVNLAAISAKPRVIRGNTGAGTGTKQDLPLTGGVMSFGERMPIKAGDRVGVDMTITAVGFGGALNVHLGTGTTEAWSSPPLADGTTAAPPGGPTAAELTISAAIEPDADGDGYGDETQDGCATSAATQGSCARAPVRLSLSSKPKQKLAKSVSVTATCDLECSLTATGNAKAGKSKKAYPLTQAAGAAAAGRLTTLSLKIPKQTGKALRKAMAKRKKASATLTVVAHDSAGGTATQSLPVSFKR